MSAFFDFLRRTLRGVRLVEAGALVVLLVMVLGVYLAKAGAGRERGDITKIQASIDDEKHDLRLLQAEVAHLEQPERMERLSDAVGLQPTPAKHEAALDQLPDLARLSMLPGEHPAKVTLAAAVQAPTAPSAASASLAGAVQ
jgi:hypothetical protein